VKGMVPYKYSSQHTSIVTLAGILKVHPAELESKMITRAIRKASLRGIWSGICGNWLKKGLEKHSWTC